MRILLQRDQTGEYFKRVGVWTKDPAEAMDFLSSMKAIDFCAANKINGVQIVLKFDQQHYDIVLPMDAGQNGRPGRVAGTV
jgi:hypothetical protein